MIIGATPETDYQILNVAEFHIRSLRLRRVFYSAFVHVNEDSNLPARTDDCARLFSENIDFIKRIGYYGTMDLKRKNFCRKRILILTYFWIQNVTGH